MTIDQWMSNKSRIIELSGTIDSLCLLDTWRVVWIGSVGAARPKSDERQL